VQAGESALEQAIMNFVINGCDSMPEGGLLTIATDVVRQENQECPELLKREFLCNCLLQIKTAGCQRNLSTNS
jgi:hypothetical protein